MLAEIGAGLATGGLGHRTHDRGRRRDATGHRHRRPRGVDRSAQPGPGPLDSRQGPGRVRASRPCLRGAARPRRDGCRARPTGARAHVRAGRRGARERVRRWSSRTCSGTGTHDTSAPTAGSPSKQLPLQLCSTACTCRRSCSSGTPTAARSRSPSRRGIRGSVTSSWCARRPTATPPRPRTGCPAGPGWPDGRWPARRSPAWSAVLCACFGPSCNGQRPAWRPAYPAQSPAAVFNTPTRPTLGPADAAPRQPTARGDPQPPDPDDRRARRPGRHRAHPGRAGAAPWAWRIRHHAGRHPSPAAGEPGRAGLCDPAGRRPVGVWSPPRDQARRPALFDPGTLRGEAAFRPAYRPTQIGGSARERPPQLSF